MRGASYLHLHLGHRSKTHDSTYPKTLVQIFKILEKVRTCGVGSWLPEVSARGWEPAPEMARVRALVAQSCPALCHCLDCSPPGFSVHGILQARILEWVAIHVSRGSSQPKGRTQVSCIAGRFFAICALGEGGAW